MGYLGSRATIGPDLRAGLTLGVESVPDGLASGLLAGVNPAYGLYGYLVGAAAGALATSSVFMSVQATGAMSVIVADVPLLHGGPQASSALFTLSVLTGAVMLLLGLLQLGTLVRFVPNAVLTGFVNAVAVNIVLGQLSNLTGYSSGYGNRVTRSLDTFLHPLQWSWASVAVGAVTIVLILVLERTPVGSLGLVVAVVVTSVAAALLGLDGGKTLDHVAQLPSSLPTLPGPHLSSLSDQVRPDPVQPKERIVKIRRRIHVDRSRTVAKSGRRPMNQKTAETMKKVLIAKTAKSSGERKLTQREPLEMG